MSDPITPSTEAPAAPETPVVVVATPEPVATPVAVAPAVETAPDIHGLDEATRDSLLFGDPAPAPAKVEAPSAPVVEPVAPVAEPVVEPPTAEMPPVEPVTPADDKLLPNRISTKQFNDREQEAIALKHDLAKDGTNISLREACERVDLKYGTPKADAVPAVPTEPEPPAEIVAARVEVAELERQLDEAGASEGVLNSDVVTLIKAHSAKLADLKTLELRTELASERQQESTQAQQATARNAVKAQVLSDYPTANDDNSPLGKEIGLLYSRIKDNPAHELHGKMQDDNFASLLTLAAVKSKTEELINSGLTPAQAEAAVKGKPTAEAKGPVVIAPPATPTQAAPVPRNILVTAPGGKQAPEPVVLSEAQALEAARKDPKLRDAALGFDSEWIVR